MSQEVRIRAALAGDLEWITARLKAHFSECYGTKRLFFQNDDFTKNFMLTLMKEHLVLVAEKGTSLIGFLAGALQPALYDPSMRVLTSYFFWVEPLERKGKAAKRLLDAFSDWGSHYADWIFFGLPPQTDISDRSMERRGFRLSERYFLMEAR